MINVAPRFSEPKLQIERMAAAVRQFNGESRPTRGNSRGESKKEILCEEDEFTCSSEKESDPDKDREKEGTGQESNQEKNDQENR